MTIFGIPFTIKAMFRVGLLMAILLGAETTFAATYQYDAVARVQYLDQTYPGGIQALYLYCANKYIAKQQFLSSVGLTGDPAQADPQAFMAACIYGDQAYAYSQCQITGVNCQKVTLVTDLAGLNQEVSMNTKSSQPANSAAFY
ncbi:MAG: hypothetical protein EBX40_00825 [Gammaproteobacteria bacterium]|nr:hypothetical protein [Gammaproteobacteria bacterium]